ncbi:MAG: integration host factor subunit beta [Candidatus Pelagibacter sp.]|nr:integration host factor subunit beta [Candidatus Pelagibacter sp.]
MAINKSDLINNLSKNFPNFLKKDILKIVDTIIDEIKASLKKGERVELRDVFMFEAKKYKSKIARNPKTNEKIFLPEKKLVKFKISKNWKKIINEKE